MTEELYNRLRQEFPSGPTPDKPFSIPDRSNFEQFSVLKKGPWKIVPTLEAITQVAKQTLKRVSKVYKLETNMEVIQGLDKGDIVIIPGYQSSITAHAIGLIDMDIEVLKVFFQSSWHANYHMTPKQIERYVAFAREYFNRFG